MAHVITKVCLILGVIFANNFPKFCITSALFQRAIFKKIISLTYCWRFHSWSNLPTILRNMKHTCTSQQKLSNFSRTLWSLNIYGNGQMSKIYWLYCLYISNIVSFPLSLLNIYCIPANYLLFHKRELLEKQ